MKATGSISAESATWDFRSGAAVAGSNPAVWLVALLSLKISLRLTTSISLFQAKCQVSFFFKVCKLCKISVTEKLVDSAGQSSSLVMSHSLKNTLPYRRSCDCHRCRSSLSDYVMSADIPSSFIAHRFSGRSAIDCRNQPGSRRANCRMS